jgi:TP901 family phage tail tape measure protein
MLVATRNVFDNAIKPFEVLDRIARLEARYAVSTNDLSQAIQRAGPLFEQFQPQSMGSVTSLDLLTGATTSIVEQTRVTGNQAATSLRFMLSRLAQPDVAKKLQDQFGINLAGASPTEMRPASEILKDISTKYQELMTPDAQGNTRSLEAANLLVTFAGARQANAAAALLEDFSTTLDRAVESSLAYGDVQERLRIQLDTVPGRLGQFNAALSSAFEAIYVKTGIRDVAKGTLSAGTGLLNLISQSGSPGLATAGIGLAGSLLMRGLGYGAVAAGEKTLEASAGMMAEKP